MLRETSDTLPNYFKRLRMNQLKNRIELLIGLNFVEKWTNQDFGHAREFLKCRNRF